MKLSLATALLLLCSTNVTGLPADLQTDPQTDLIEQDPVFGDVQDVDLEKRRGGGHGGGRGGGGSSGGGSGGRTGSSGSSGGSSRGGGSRSSGSSGSHGTTTSPSFGSGGRYGSSTSGWGLGIAGGHARRSIALPVIQRAIPRLIQWSTAQRTYGGSRYYAGGATSSYSAGHQSPLGITPFLLPDAALAFFPGIWLHGAYAYPYSHHYEYYHENDSKNESLPVVCVCQEYQPCGCDDNDDSSYYECIFNGTQPTNTSDIRVVNANGTEKIYINGTLPNGTDSENHSSSGASTLVPNPLHASGYWITFPMIGLMVWGL